jgi:uncharacterized repeat protein (TIGR01451 family)
VADTLPASITSAAWTCTASGGAACPSASGSGNLNQTLATLPAGGVVTYTITGTVGTNPPAVITNTATADVTGGVCADASGTPTGVAMPCPATATNPSLPVFSISKTANTTAALAPGGQVVYTIIATNTGAAAATNVTVADTLPAGIASASWTCTGSGAVCPNASGSGSLSQLIASLPSGSSVTYVITATLATTGLPASIANVASVTSPNGGLCQDGSALPCQTGQVSNPVTVPVITSTTPVPALDARALVVLMLLLAATAIGARRRPGGRRG